LEAELWGSAVENCFLALWLATVARGIRAFVVILYAKLFGVNSIDEASILALVALV
jgi:hypothetical protein